VNHIEDNFIKLLKHLGCDECTLTYIDTNNHKKTYILRFNKRYMKLTLHYYQFFMTSLAEVYTMLQTEINEFLLTGKNEITNEMTDSNIYE
jgi:uncharacterized protein with gpF-like domain